MVRTRFSMSDKARAELYQMWQDGVSCTVLAEKFNRSRSSIINMIARGRKMGIDLKKRYEDRKRDTHNNVRPVLKRYIVPELPDTEEGISVMDAHEGSCREVIGRLRYCGKQVVNIGPCSYCLEHAQKNYVGV